MPNQLNKNKNKLKENDEICTAQENLILAQQAEHRRRFQQITDGHRSIEKLLEETRQWLDLVEEAREEFLNLHTLREENPDGRGLTRTARSAKGARVWSELFVRDTLSERTASVDENPSSPNSATVGSSAGVQNNEGVQNNVGVQNNASVQNNTGVQNSAGTQQNPQHPIIMAGPKEKLPKYDGDGAANPIRHCKTCKTIWRANGITDTNEWVRQFTVTLRGVAIDWFADTDPQKLNNWDNIKKEFITEFQLLHEDNKIVAEIYNTKHGKNETVRVYASKLKDLINKMKNKSADGLQKRWFIEGLHSKLWKKMKIVPPSSYTKAYNRAMNLESEQKTKKKKKSSSSDLDDDASPKKREQ